MENQIKKSRLSRLSFILNSIFFLPAILFGIALGNTTASDEFYAGMIIISQFITLVLTGSYIYIVILRLHDLNRRGWYSLLLIPPFTLFLLLALMFIKSGNDNRWGVQKTHTSIFGIRTKGLRFFGIVPIGLLLVYFAALFATFYFDAGSL